jgi:hypothetical protein
MMIPPLAAFVTLGLAGWASSAIPAARRVRWLLPVPSLVAAWTSTTSWVAAGYIMVAIVAFFLVVAGHPKRLSANTTRSTSN